MKRILAAALAASTLIPTTAFAQSEKMTVIFGGRDVGRLNTDRTGERVAVDFDYKNNGRGPTIKEVLRLDPAGLPLDWTITGATTFGSKVDERFARAGNRATWTDGAGKGSARVREPALYVGQSASPWALGVYARALLNDADGTMPALPGGALRLVKGESFDVAGKGQPTATVTAYTIYGIDTVPQTILLAADRSMFAYVTPNTVMVRKGYEAAEADLRGRAARWSTERYVAIEKKVAHRYGAPVRIRNVRVFDPADGSLTAPMSVLVSGREIAAVEPNDSPATPGEVAIDGAGGTIVPGMYEMHGHLGQDDAMLNLVAGITTIRDMGNDNDVLATLTDRIDAGTIGGPRVIKSGMIEGKSPFNTNNGILVDSEAKALDAVRWYAARGYWQVKSYNSMNPAWIADVAKEAHRLGLRVAGHVPAFSTADAVIAAGFDEVTHINQFMLGWVIKPTEDTRTLFRLYALKRLPALDLQSAQVQKTIQAMVDKKVAIDPTIGIHENLLLNRDGNVPAGAVDYIDHLPVGAQRDLKKAWIDTSAPGDDAAYRAAYPKILATVRMLNDRGVLIVPGTDTGGSFTYHRELELLQQIGMTPAQVLKRATLDMARYSGQDQRLGSVTKGKLADFFLVPGDPTKDLKAIKRIAMVVKDGTFYYPEEVYPEFGIKPFANAPRVVLPK